jgi:hypothetical protein
MKKFNVEISTSKFHYLHFFVFTLLFFSVIFLLPIKMDQTDDFGLMILAAGIYTGEYENMLIFISPIIGGCLNYLYSNVSNQLNWYSIFIVSIYFVSWFSILFLILKSKQFKQQKIIGFYFLFLTFGIYFLINFTFTVASFLIGISAILYFVFSEHSPKNNAIICVFFILCFLVRSFVFYYLIILLSAIMLLFVIAKITKVNFKRISCLLFCALIVFTYNNSLISGNQEWKKFMEYNIVRGRIQDNPNLYFTNKEEIKQKLNWSETDYQMLYYWNTDGEKLFNTTQLHKILESIKHSTFWSLYYLQFVLASSLFYCAVALLFLFFFINRNFNLYFFVLILFMLSTLVIISQIYIMKERVFLPVLLLLFALLLFIYKFKERNYLLVTATSLSLILMSFKTYNKVVENSHQIKMLSKDMVAFTKLNNCDFVLWGNLKMNCFTGFKQPFLILKDRIYISNWLSHSPHNSKILKKRKVDSIYEYSIKNSNCLWLVEKDKFDFKSGLLKQYYIQYYGVKVDCKLLNLDQWEKTNWAFFRIIKKTSTI